MNASITTGPALPSTTATYYGKPAKPAKPAKTVKKTKPKPKRKK